MGTFSPHSDYNISDISGDAPNATFGGGEATVTFKDEALNDYHLDLADTAARDQGVDLSSDATLSFSIDIDGGAQSLFDVSLAENDGATLKAAWNWSMLNEDQTINEGNPPPFTHRGIHNPDLAIEGLTRAISAVQEVAP